MLECYSWVERGSTSTSISYTSNPIYSKSTAFVLLSVILLLLIGTDMLIIIRVFRMQSVCNTSPASSEVAMADVSSSWAGRDFFALMRWTVLLLKQLWLHTAGQISQNCLVTRHCLFPALLSTHNPVLLSWNDFEWG